MSSLEDDLNVILNTVENNEIVLLTSTGPLPLLRLLASKYQVKVLFVSNNAKLKHISPYNLNTSFYEEKLDGDIVWMSYDLVWYHILQNSSFFTEFELIVFDSDRSLVADLVFSVIGNLKLPLPCCLVLCGQSQVDTYKECFRKFETSVLGLVEGGANVEVLYEDAINVEKEITNTINTIFKSDDSIYDVLVLLPNPQILEFLKVYHITSSDYSIVRNIEDFKPSTNCSKRLIFAQTAQAFKNFANNIKYVIDSAQLRTFKADQFNPSMTHIQITRTNIDQIRHNIDCLQPVSVNHPLKYIILADRSTLCSNCPSIREGPMIVPFFLGLSKLLTEHSASLSSFVFISKPDEKVVRNAINQLIYLGLVSVQPNYTDVQVTSKGACLLSFHFTNSDLSFPLHHSLITCTTPQPALQLIAIVNVLNYNSLRKYLNVVKSGHDFNSLIELFDKFKGNEKSLNLHFSTPSSLKKKLLHHFRNLVNHYDKSKNTEVTSSHFATFEQAMVSAFQFNLCVFDQEHFVPIFGSKDYEIDSPESVYSNGDIVILSNLAVSNNDPNQVPTFSSKIPKLTIYEMKLPSLKFV